jgi:hypothetical protein
MVPEQRLVLQPPPKPMQTTNAIQTTAMEAARPLFIGRFRFSPRPS